MPNTFSQGPFAPTQTTTIVGAGGGTWQNVANIAVDDGTSFADCGPSGGIGANSVSDSLVGYAYGFSIPLSATIVGVVFTYKGFEQSGVFSGNIFEQNISLTDGTTLLGTPKINVHSLSTSLAPYSLGGSGDTWAASLTPGLANANLGVAANFFNQDLAHARNAFIDAFRLTVYYTIPTVFFSFSSN